MRFIRTLRTFVRPKAPASPETLKRLLSDYRIYRRTAATWMRVSRETFACYCLPTTSKQHIPIPELRWEELLRKIKEHAHPNEEVTI